MTRLYARALTALLLLCVVSRIVESTLLGVRPLVSLYKPQPPLHTNRLDTVLDIRGGANRKVVSSDSDTGGILARLVQSILGTTESISPILSKPLRGFFRLLENVTGLTLLPSKKLKMKKPSQRVELKSHKKRTKSSKTSSSDETIVKIKESVPNKDTVKPKEATKTKSKPITTAKSATKVSKQAQKHVETKIPLNNPNYRIQRELKEFVKDPPPNLTVNVGSNLRVWIVTMEGAPGSIYEGETFKLRIKFPPQYPTVPPSVFFLPPNIPVHEHVYTNGDICLSLLGQDWRPTMTAQSIAVSILSILSSAQSKCLPMDNARHAQNKPGEYQKDWVYHDDLC